MSKIAITDYEYIDDIMQSLEKEIRAEFGLNEDDVYISSDKVIVLEIVDKS